MLKLHGRMLPPDVEQRVRATLAEQTTPPDTRYLSDVANCAKPTNNGVQYDPTKHFLDGVPPPPEMFPRATAKRPDPTYEIPAVVDLPSPPLFSTRRQDRKTDPHLGDRPDSSYENPPGITFEKETE